MGRIEFTGDEAHRLRQVLRVASGDPVAVFDGRGREWTGRVSAVSKVSVEVSALESTTPAAERRVPLALAFGVLKGDQMDAVVRDATMLGVAVIAPMRTAHVTVPQKAWQAGAARDRWQRVAIASASQCRRAVVPEVRPVADFQACLREPAALRLICVEPGAAASTTEWSSRPAPASVQLLVGPEGGWSRGEIDEALASGALAVSLGPRTLRAETAPVVAITLVSAAWGW